MDIDERKMQVICSTFICIFIYFRYRRERERVRKEEDQVFPARPIKHKRSSEKVRQVDYDEGMFILFQEIFNFD